jgi:hypothetical protein
MPILIDMLSPNIPDDVREAILQEGDRYSEVIKVSLLSEGTSDLWQLKREFLFEDVQPDHQNSQGIKRVLRRLLDRDLVKEIKNEPPSEFPPDFF